MIKFLTYLTVVACFGMALYSATTLHVSAQERVDPQITEKIQITTECRNDDSILSCDYRKATKALQIAEKHRDFATIRLGLMRDYSFELKMDILDTIGRLKDRSFVPDLTHTLENNRGQLSGGTETLVAQALLNRKLILMIGDLTGLEFDLPKMPDSNSVEKFAAENYVTDSQIDKALRGIQIVENEQVKKLLAEIKNEKLITEDPARLANIIETLGQLRVEKAIPDLIKYLGFRRIHDWEGTGVLLHPLPSGGDYPAVGALGSIGNPALPGLIKVIKNESEESVRSQKAGETIQEIFRDDLSKALEYLDNQILKAGSLEKESKIEKVKDDIEHRLYKLRSVNENEKLEQKLIQILRDNKINALDRDIVINAIITLGANKVIKAIPELIQYLDYGKIYPEPPKATERSRKYKGEEVIGVEVGKTITASGRYPATEALLRIGEPSLPALIEVIETEDGETVKATNALYTLEQIYRSDLSAAAEYVMKAMLRTDDAAKQIRLENAQIKILNDIETLRKFELKLKN